MDKTLDLEGEDRKPDEEIVRGIPTFTYGNHGLQNQNLETLLGLMSKNINPADMGDGDIIDAGGGNGFLLAKSIRDKYLNSFLHGRTIHEVDLRPDKLDGGRATYKLVEVISGKELGKPAPDVQFHQGNLRSSGLKSLIGGEEARAIISNSVLHWIPRRFLETTFKNFYSALKDDGYLAVSSAAPGTAKDLLDAYKSVVSVLSPDLRINRELLRMVQRNPFGTMHLQDLTALAARQGFECVSNLSQEESIRYPDPKIYLDTVEAYGGWEVLLEPFKDVDMSPEFEDDLKAEVIARYMNNTVERARLGTGYFYKQHNNYVVFRKMSPERIIRHLEEMSIFGVRDYLQNDYLHSFWDKQIAEAVEPVKGMYEELRKQIDVRFRSNYADNYQTRMPLNMILQSILSLDTLRDIVDERESPCRIEVESTVHNYLQFINDHAADFDDQLTNGFQRSSSFHKMLQVDITFPNIGHEGQRAIEEIVSSEEFDHMYALGVTWKYADSAPGTYKQSWFLPASYFRSML